MAVGGGGKASAACSPLPRCGISLTNPYIKKGLQVAFFRNPCIYEKD
tara:strand:+ start:585 stop:725 length:141 start_codon:yes stop_codon:yes gene_type:complete